MAKFGSSGGFKVGRVPTPKSVPTPKVPTPRNNPAGRVRPPLGFPHVSPPRIKPMPTRQYGKMGNGTGTGGGTGGALGGLGPGGGGPDDADFGNTGLTGES